MGSNIISFGFSTFAKGFKFPYLIGNSFCIHAHNVALRQEEERTIHFLTR